MFVIGNAKDARSLAKEIKIKTKTIFELTKEINGKLKALENCFQDDGYAEIEDVVIRIYRSINTHLEDVKDLSVAIDLYADILERK